MGAITKCTPIKNQFISNIFLTQKSNGKFRFILNLKPLNKFIVKTHFKMEDYRTACKLIPKNAFLATIDLKESYLLIPISHSDRKYLRFQFQHPGAKYVTFYEFTAMPYGLCTAPRVFTKIMKEVVTYLRNRGLKSVTYLDDILCIGNDYESCAENVNKTLILLKNLGFVINMEKSNLKPTQSCQFLGFIFNSVSMTISLPDSKRKSIAQLVHKFMKLPTCNIRDFAKLIGTLIAACPAVKYGWLYTKVLERHKFLFLDEQAGNYDAKIKLPVSILEDLNWWSKGISHAYNDLRISNYYFEIYTDASRTGWGAVHNNKRVYGHWKAIEQNHHINYLELLAVFLGLKSFVANESNCAILLRVDNTTAISYINRMGSIQFPHLNKLTRSIWQWCEKRHLFIFASYVNTKENKADSASRIINPDTEWELSDEIFSSITQKLGKPEIDLFASRSNTKCEQFVSWKQDPDAIAVDAFTISWQDKYFYAFPPFSLVLKCIRKIIDDRASGILIFPHWPSQPWYPLLLEILDSEIIYFNPNKGLLQSNFRDHHPLHKKLTLGAAKLCGSRS